MLLFVLLVFGILVAVVLTVRRECRDRDARRQLRRDQPPVTAVVVWWGEGVAPPPIRGVEETPECIVRKLEALLESILRQVKQTPEPLLQELEEPLESILRQVKQTPEPLLQELEEPLARRLKELERSLESTGGD